VKITQGDTELIRLKIFISSVQKELQKERTAIGRFLVMDDFLRECTVPRIFEDYPQPLRPNPKAYLDLLRQCQIYLLIIGTEYGSNAGGGLSATHEAASLRNGRFRHLFAVMEHKIWISER
jgi:hypothetical protein